jgi:undecaprenyl-diphosphatase
MEKIIELDKRLLLYLNGFHHPALDPVVLFITHTFTWLPLYILLLYLIIKHFKQDWWIFVIGIALTILLTDRITSGLMKPFFERLRPSREPSLQGLVHLVDGYVGGKFGFASSHAANTFGTATFFFVVFKAARKYFVWLFLWAIVMTYTRIYLGVHYPGDIIVGGIIGVLAGIVGAKFAFWLKKKVDKKRAEKNLTTG